MANFKQRLGSVVVAMVLGWFLFLRARSAWVDYWLLTDGKQGVALVTQELWTGHDGVGYVYKVGGQQYTGKDSRPNHTLSSNGVRVGDQTAVYYSESHPWLSLFDKPRAVAEGWPFLIIAVFIEIFAIIAVFNPKSGWALASDSEKKPVSDKT